MINQNRNRMRFWSIVLSACLLVELLPVSAFGAGESWEMRRWHGFLRSRRKTVPGRYSSPQT